MSKAKIQPKIQPKIPELIKPNHDVALDEVFLVTYVKSANGWLICKDKKMYDEKTGEFVCFAKDFYGIIDDRLLY